jgi:predicted glutamine amidotransferase
MCRILAIMSKNPFSTCFLQDFRLLAEEGKVARSAKSRGHKDGWGIVHFDEQPMYLGHRALYEDGSEANAAVSTDYNKICETVREKQLKGILLTHLRKASSGGKMQENTAPFIDKKKEWIFSHNGTIYSLGSEEVSDSRRLFQMLLEEIEKHGDEVEGIRSTVKQIRGNYKYSSLLFILSNGKHLYAYRDYTRSLDWDYYTIKYAKTDDATLIFSQEETWKLEWEPIPNRGLVVADHNLKIEGPIKI